MSNMPRGTFMQAMEKYTKSIKAFISAQGFGHYSKPNGGIPKTDLDQSVQTSLGKADSALQDFTETDPTVPAWAKASSKPSYTQDEVGDGSTYKRVTSTEKSTWNNKGTYSKPSGGIPKTDLASTVQTSLGKADTALQSFTETDPTVPAWAKASSKPSYTASEVGLGNVGNFKAVSTVASQGLSDTEKANARTNIGGGTYSKPSGGIPKTDLASAVQTSLGKADSALQSETDPTVPAWAKAASKPSYTASEVGLGNVGNFKAVSTVASQGLSDTEKSNARANIGAGTGNGTYSKPSGGIPKTDLASAVQTSLGKADTALQSHQTVKQDGITGATVNRFGTCSTAAATAAKTVSITSGTFNLEAGARVSVKFANANTAGTPTLNVNSKGAKNIFSKGSQITTGSNKSLLAGTVDFIYDGTQWHLIGNYIDTNTTYSNASTSAAGLMSAADKTKLNGIATGANNYTHPTTAGNKHIPSGGSSGQILVYGGSSGTASWSSDYMGASLAPATFATLATGVNYSRSALVKQGKHISGWVEVDTGTSPYYGTLITINTTYRPASTIYVYLESDGRSILEVGTNGVVDTGMSGATYLAVIHFDYVIR